MTSSRVAIVGGGPAGLTAARELRSLNPILIDPDRPAVPSTCGGVLGPLACRMLGHYPECFHQIQRQAVRLSEVTLAINGHHAGSHPAPPNGMFVLPRERLHKILHRHFASNIRYRTDYVRELEFQPETIRLRMRSGSVLKTELVVDASGHRQISSPNESVTGPTLFGREWRIPASDNWNNKLTMILFSGGYAGITRLSETERTISAVTTNNPENSSGTPLFHQIKQALPPADQKLLPTNPPEPHSSKAGFWQTNPEPIGPHHVAIGDAQGFAMPLSGEGIAMALREARWLSHLKKQSTPSPVSSQLQSLYRRQIVEPYQNRLNYWHWLHTLASKFPSLPLQLPGQNIAYEALLKTFFPRTSPWPALTTTPDKK